MLSGIALKNSNKYRYPKTNQYRIFEKVQTVDKLLKLNRVTFHDYKISNEKVRKSLKVEQKRKITVVAEAEYFLQHCLASVDVPSIILTRSRVREVRPNTNLFRRTGRVCT